MELTDKAAYLKGLMDGLGIDASTKEGKVLLAMSDLLSELTAAVVTLDEDLSVAYEHIDLLEDELAEVEEELEELEEDLYEEDDEDEEEEDEEDEDDDEGYEYELTCPKCGTKNLVDEETLMSEEIYCGHCATPFTIEFEDEEEAEEEAED
ncbi:MAG: hypothetical protein IJ347_04080 [Faecalibacterium sp.]|nr:hypothetical protein [Faecalibacterium sp.]